MSLEMKRILCALALVAALVSSAAAQDYLPPAPLLPIGRTCLVNAPFTLADQYYGFQGAVLNIRAWPNGPILGALANGTPVQILSVGPAENGSPWAYVVIPDGSAGWVFLQYLYC